MSVPELEGARIMEVHWWARRWFLFFLIAASAIPLFWPETPPLVDVPGHMGRFRVQLDLANSPELQRYFEFHWALVGNLGVDLLVQLLAPMMGLEPAVKLIVLAIPPLTVTGIFWISKEVHGRIVPTTLFAVPFAYSFSFNYGFLNYALSLGLALCAFGLWLRMTRQGRLHARNLLFVPISFALWVAHAFGWGILGLLAFAAELIRHHDADPRWNKAFLRSCLNVAPMGLPIIIMILGHGDVTAGRTDHFFHPALKAYSLIATLRDRWLLWDSLGVAVGVMLIGAASFDRRLGWSRRLVIPAIVLAITFLIMPARLLGLSYADVRLASVIFIVGVLSIRTQEHDIRADRTLAWLGLTFLLLRLAGTTLSYGIADRQMRGWLQALDHIPAGSPVLSLVGDYCHQRWEMPRHMHAGSFMIVRRNGFSNDQWQAAGAQLLRVVYREAGFFNQDRSSFIYSDECFAILLEDAEKPPAYDQRLESALSLFPRMAFDYVWMVDVPDFDMAKPLPGLTPVWRRPDAILYRVEHQGK